MNYVQIIVQLSKGRDTNKMPDTSMMYRLYQQALTALGYWLNYVRDKNDRESTMNYVQIIVKLRKGHDNNKMPDTSQLYQIVPLKA